jgi:2-polyprenyl-3-methyl-5-hydroxy-6-metoxy-1,4-benzoquinol methylase
MASIEVNRSIWDRDYKWKLAGDEWSAPWGGPEMQWFGMLLPRIHGYLPAKNILEIAPGHGRWTQFLAPMAESFVGVDLSENCVAKCRERFESLAHATFYTNDGKSLAMVQDNSIDFAFSFDSLVHCEEDVIGDYLAELKGKLTDGGVGFIHHSNMGEYSRYFRTVRMIPRGAGLLSRLGLIESNEHLRAHSMSAKRFRSICEELNLYCISQEIIPWGSNRLIDCISVFRKNDITGRRTTRVFRNKHLMTERDILKSLAGLYGE